MLAYIYDEALKSKANQQGRNYWDIYIQEILDMLGARAQRISPLDLETASLLDDMKTVILGSQSSASLSSKAIEALEQWVKEGGILIGFGVQGLDDVFGITSLSEIQQKPDEYSISGYFDFRPHDITHEIHPFLFNDQQLIILSDIQSVSMNMERTVELARLFDTSGKEMEAPAITWSHYGQGYAGYFTFDVAKTVWLLHQGRPLPEPTEDRPFLNTGDLQIQGSNSRKIPYADEICFVLQNMIAQNPQPFIHQIPSQDGQVPDALLYYGGDEYFGPTEISLQASDWMKEKGLGYQINMQEFHPITKEEVEHIVSNGHDISQYLGMYKEDNYTMKEEYYLEKTKLFRDKFGFSPCITVNHWLRWAGWTEAAKWMKKAGIKGDNSYIANTLTIHHPLSNGPRYGFSAATAYPFYFYDDHQGNNDRIDFMEQPIICYEVGHRGTIQDYQTDVSSEVYLPLEMAIKYHMVMNFFYHPGCIARFPLCRKAIEEILHYIEHRDALVLHWSNKEVAEWWEARSDTTIENVDIQNVSTAFDIDSSYPAGMIVKMLLKRPVRRVVLDGGIPAVHEVKREFAGDWLFIVVPSGKHNISVFYEWDVFRHPNLHKNQ